MAISPALKQPQLSKYNQSHRFLGLWVEGQGRDCLEVLLSLLSSIYENASQLKSESDSCFILYTRHQDLVMRYSENLS